MHDACCKRVNQKLTLIILSISFMIDIRRTQCALPVHDSFCRGGASLSTGHFECNFWSYPIYLLLNAGQMERPGKATESMDVERCRAVDAAVEVKLADDRSTRTGQ